MDNCIFCRIIAGEVPAAKVYEDQLTVAFLDIAPVRPGHTLVVPKKHFCLIEEADLETLCRTIKVVQRVGRAIKEGLGVPAYNLSLNNGREAGQIVPHLHFHLVPRIQNDRLHLWPQGKYQGRQMEEIAEKIRRQFTVKGVQN